MKILAIESSCDETAASVIEVNAGHFNILSNVVSSQVKIHAQYGGIVPEVAARLHIEKILPVIDLALGEARQARPARRVKQANNSFNGIAYIAVCAGPGLISSLAVGIETAKTLAWANKIPLVKVNHLEGHLLSVINSKSETRNPNKSEILNPKLKNTNKLLKSTLINSNQLSFPAIGLIVSGGHTQLMLVKDYLKYKMIGQTIDDAAGEAFDKAAKILGLGYPGGPAISAAAARISDPKSYILNSKPFPKISLPRPMINSNDFNFSFSGLKTAVLYKWRDLEKIITDKNDLQIAQSLMAAEVQRAIIDVLVRKTVKAAREYNAKTVIVSGGVSANRALRLGMEEAVAKQLPGVKLLVPEMKLTGDNAAMIGLASYYHIKNKNFTDPLKLSADPNWQL